MSTLAVRFAGFRHISNILQPDFVTDAHAGQLTFARKKTGSHDICLRFVVVCSSLIDDLNGDGLDIASDHRRTWVHVFVRCLQHMIGVIIFIRIQWITEEVGLALTVGFIVLAAIVSILTTITISAFCTEQRNGFFATANSPFYDDITIDPRRGVRQGDTVSPKLFAATLEDVMRRLEWDNMGVRVDGRLLHHLRFADDIVFIKPNVSQAERMLADFDDACGKIGLQLNLTKTMFMRNG
ncbi:hypothetical protein ANCCEY_03707 [Ancylostoma ceylanicum]|uniref:Reverse transcriptase domain-containing protein n=1 Tax=Ancylostoma ceylanicum TaxID=53326 RepID=A0A0D6M465_9BILA|nr:hypothetical protein ANCCEY_03707 [Ancylostoma ceylanicum]